MEWSGNISNSNITIYNQNCFDVMPTLKEASVDLILCDLPYGTTQNKWDSTLPLDKLWTEYKRLLKPNGAVVLTASQPFTSMLVLSNLDMFKVEMIWEKTICSGQLNVKRQPLRAHESILIFYSKQPTYNEQLTEGKPYKIKRKVKFEAQGYGEQKNSEKNNTGFRHAKTVIKIPNPRVKGGHPTQKPVELMEYIIKTYSNQGDTVLDNCMGSGSTGIACLNLNRNFVGIELENKYYEMAKSKMKGRIESGERII